MVVKHVGEGAFYNLPIKSQYFAGPVSVACDHRCFLYIQFPSACPLGKTGRLEGEGVGKMQILMAGILP